MLNLTGKDCKELRVACSISRTYLGSVLGYRSGRETLRRIENDNENEVAPKILQIFWSYADNKGVNEALRRFKYGWSDQEETKDL